MHRPRNAKLTAYRINENILIQLYYRSTVTVHGLYISA